MDARLPRGAVLPHAQPDTLNCSLRTIWHKSAPGPVRKAFRSGKDAKGWAAWAKHLAKREEPAALSALLPGKSSPLAWVLPDADDNLQAIGQFFNSSFRSSYLFDKVWAALGPRA